MFTNDGKQFVAWLLGSSLPVMYQSSIGIGSGSGTATVNDHILVAETKRTMITGSPNYSETRKVAFQADFTSVQMSGLNFSEFGLFQSGAVGVGSVWQREAFGSVNFDGTNELQIYVTQEVF